MTVSISDQEAMLVAAPFMPLSASFSFNGLLSASIRIGPVSGRVSVALSATNEGRVEANITSATVAGIGLFGLVRRKVEDAVVALCAGLPCVECIKSPGGNLEFAVRGVHCTKAAVGAGMLQFDVELLD